MNPDKPTLESFETFLEAAYATTEDPTEAASILLSLQRLQSFRRSYRETFTSSGGTP